MMRHKLAGMMLFSMATAGLVACSDKLADESGNGLEGSESYVYMNVAVALPSPSTTRSGTDDPTGDGNDQTNSDENKKEKPDYEYGYEFENKVNNLLLVIAAENNEYITHTFIPDITDAAGDGVKNNFTTEAQKFSRSDITAAYGDFFKMNPADNKYYAHIYAFCNPTTALKARFDDLKQNNGRGNTEWVNWTNENEADDISLREKIWGGNGGKPEDVNPGFLMSNKDVKRVEFPSLDGWSSYSSPSHPFKLSTPTDPVRVERTAARIDYKDGSSNNDNTYSITLGGDDTKKIFDVELLDMALVNMSKNYHYLRHVSNDGTNTGWKVCENETPNNYVVDTDWAAKQRVEGITAATESDHFYYPLFKTSGEYNEEGWFSTSVGDVVDGKFDLWDIKDSEEHGNYHIWRYVTENTIPEALDNEAPYSQQKTVQSTGVVFKAQIKPGANAADALSPDVIDALAGDGSGKVLYLYNSILYAGFDALVEKALKDGVESKLYSGLTKVLAHWVGYNLQYVYEENPDENAQSLTIEEYLEIKNGNSNAIISSLESDLNFKKEIAAQKIITMYRPSSDKNYYCYYFYWNRHNDNGNNGDMGKMEFATVRNNVYKLSVTKIGQLGHPTDPSDDPDPVDPEDPDENDDVYMDVTVEVLPWVVRVNDIEF